MPSLLELKDLAFIFNNYNDQIEALNFFFKESGVKGIPSSKIKFGGGTALAIYYFQHRLSFDIDLFVSDIQYLSFIRPKIWIDDSNSFQTDGYIDQQNHIGLITKNDIKVDILIDDSSNTGKIDNSRKLVDFDLYIEDIEDIIAKKITFRKKDNKTRDIIDIAICLEDNQNLFNELLSLEKVTTDDLKILKEALLDLNKKRYISQLKVVQPFEKYLDISNKAPEYIISKIDDLKIT
ncbi:nucleotidyl transferase AbiEii/AbiGii toxin family protein [Aliarcobacter cryaerophilus]|uniref:nucleotidyl transferase AbiEii/AbiGii toxin family protein n=1 Tax=Aliarcobacter cryaerophilus TaxID=28198 RepID=UPI0021B5275C|nr:nucleotidyl transferase AbiEii/AbiGii toxin family protein [Aliarcobacter cryaerophilus]MCT7405867.1 nucleotidyl transferase AbiEii/AbiGii toxin family protein [Aliarcobacter cryaerophilus]MCT7503586.1 nucleotidyl transferase AbiEii/AbiGii toxin family protein [Aliarcobacter cryaerophilus]